MNTISAIRRLLAVAAVTAAVALSAPSIAAGNVSAGSVSAGGAANPSASNVLAAATCTRGARACPIRITFAKGAYAAQASSRLTGMKSQRWFTVHVRAGQTMIVIVAGHGATRGTVYLPAGGSVGQPGGRIYDDSVPTTGNYRIRVTESPMGQAWSGRIDVVVVVY